MGGQTLLMIARNQTKDIVKPHGKDSDVGMRTRIQCSGPECCNRITRNGQTDLENV